MGDVLAKQFDFDISPLSSEEHASGDDASICYLNENMLDWTMTLPVMVEHQLQEGLLHVQMARGLMVWERQQEAQHPNFHLTVEAINVAASSPRADFGVALRMLQKQLPQNVYIRCCYWCAFSSGFPFGMGSAFGALACFKRTKPEILAIKHHDPDESAVLELWEKREQIVQETYVCPEFQSDHGSLSSSSLP